MLSALLMLRRAVRALRHAVREEEFLPVLSAGWIKLFTILYQLLGIGILVEILRRLGIAFIAVRAEDRDATPEGARRRR